mmetsp:Transcript_2276/g.3433  ORF Transcript_2276/g.3433 Transcript_2276/m.3433 type:complete len:162 (+) Transcript_2276:992-1477(+)
MKMVALSKDEKTAYCNTYDGKMYILNVHDLENPKIETIINVPSTFNILSDYQWALQFKYNVYTLYDMSQIYMKPESMVPHLVSEHRPIEFTNLNLTTGEYEFSIQHYLDDFEVLVLVERPIKGQPQVSLFDTSENKLKPKLMGRFHPPVLDDAPRFEFNLN